MILFFDTETAGLPANYKAPVSDLGNWPRMIQLGFQAYRESGELVHEFQSLIKPPQGGFKIDEGAFRTHGISNDKCESEGLELGFAVSEFVQLLNNCTILVAHNLNFDRMILGAEFIRLGVRVAAKEYKTYCTMQSTTDLVKISGKYGYKWPRLQELHKHLFGIEFEGAHDALTDVRATAKCFFELKRIGHIQ